MPTQQILIVATESAFLTHQDLLHVAYGDACLLGESLLFIGDRGANLDDGAETLAGVCLFEEQLHLSLITHDNRNTTCKMEVGGGKGGGEGIGKP